MIRIFLHLKLGSSRRNEIYTHFVSFYRSSHLSQSLSWSLFSTSIEICTSVFLHVILLIESMSPTLLLTMQCILPLEKALSSPSSRLPICPCTSWIGIRYIQTMGNVEFGHNSCDWKKCWLRQNNLSTASIARRRFCPYYNWNATRCLCWGNLSVRSFWISPPYSDGEFIIVITMISMRMALYQFISNHTYLLFSTFIIFFRVDILTLPMILILNHILIQIHIIIRIALLIYIITLSLNSYSYCITSCHSHSF